MVTLEKGRGKLFPLVVYFAFADTTLLRRVYIWGSDSNEMSPEKKLQQLSLKSLSSKTKKKHDYPQGQPIEPVQVQ